jgi:hypothetical protein
MRVKGFEAEERAAIDQHLLIEVLRSAPGRRFSASALKGLTARKSPRRWNGVPKTVVRRRLEDVPGVSIADDASGLWFFWSGSP